MSEQRLFVGDTAFSPEQYQSYVEEAIESVDLQWHNFCTAQDPVSQANALVELNNAMSDLISWHRTYDPNTGELDNFDE